MAEQILDGKGTGSRAEVDSNNRLHTFAISEGLSLDAAKDGMNYMKVTGTNFASVDITFDFRYVYL